MVRRNIPAASPMDEGLGYRNPIMVSNDSKEITSSARTIGIEYCLTASDRSK
jgi:hypothetical protein